MEALIQKRIRTKEPFAWKNDAHRYDASTLSASSASAAAASGAASSASAVDELMRYVTYQAGERAGAGTPASERWKFAPSKTNSAPVAPGLLFESILNLFADTKEELYVKDIVEKTMGKVNPADVPPEMSSAHLVLAALSFLSAPMPSLDQSSEGGHDDESEGMKLLHDTFPQLPLLENVSGLSTKITWRTYKLAYTEWKGLDSDEALGRKVRNLEAAFLMSTVAFPSRCCLTPRLSSTEEEREVLRTGFVPASMDVLSVSTGVTPSNSRPNTPTPTSSKKKKKKDGKTAQSTAAASTASASAVLAATPAKSPNLTVPPASSGAVVPTPLDASALPLITSGPKRKASGDDRSSSADAEPPTKKVAKVVDANAQVAGAS